MAKVHDRILQITLVADDSAETIAVSSVKYFRDRAMLDAGTGLELSFTGGAASTSPKELEFGEACPPPTHLRFVFTVQA
jgi:hypothetical protein